MSQHDFQNDPAFQGLVDRFVGGFPERLEEIRVALQTGDVAAVRVLAHRMKGAGGGFGFDELTEKAAAVERLACANHRDRLSESIDALATLCEAIADQRERQPAFGG